MTLDQASKELHPRIGGMDGMVRVSAEGSIVVYVSDPKAGEKGKLRYGGAYMDHPRTVQTASTATAKRRRILTVYPTRIPVRKA